MNITVLIVSLLVGFGSMIAFALKMQKKLSEIHIKGVYSWGMIFSYSIVIAGTLYAVWFGFTEGYSRVALFVGWGYAFYTGLGTSLGLHRHDTHGSFKAHPVVQFFLSTGAWMGGMKKWTWIPDHNLHHEKEDTLEDMHTPYMFNPVGDFWGLMWSHLGWMLVDRPELEVLKKTDISKIPFIRTERYLFVPCLLLGFFVPFAFLGQEGLWISFLRMFYMTNITFSINSFGHRFGKQVRERSKSRNGTWIGALFTMVGERYHNNHHADMRSAFLGWRWYDVDAGKWLLVFLEQLGLVWDVKRPGRNKLHPPNPNGFPLAA